MSAVISRGAPSTEHPVYRIDSTRTTRHARREGLSESTLNPSHCRRQVFTRVFFILGVSDAFFSFRPGILKRYCRRASREKQIIVKYERGSFFYPVFLLTIYMVNYYIPTLCIAADLGKFYNRLCAINYNFPNPLENVIDFTLRRLVQVNTHRPYSSKIYNRYALDERSLGAIRFLFGLFTTLFGGTHSLTQTQHHH